MTPCDQKKNLQLVAIRSILTQIPLPQIRTPNRSMTPNRETFKFNGQFKPKDRAFNTRSPLSSQWRPKKILWFWGTFIYKKNTKIKMLFAFPLSLVWCSHFLLTSKHTYKYSLFFSVKNYFGPSSCLDLLQHYVANFPIFPLFIVASFCHHFS